MHFLMRGALAAAVLDAVIPEFAHRNILFGGPCCVPCVVFVKNVFKVIRGDLAHALKHVPSKLLTLVVHTFLVVFFVLTVTEFFGILASR